MASPHPGEAYWNAALPAYSIFRAVYKILLYVFGSERPVHTRTTPKSAVFCPVLP
jgi:hypothetical protein